MARSIAPFLYQDGVPSGKNIYGVAGGSLNSAGFDAKSTQAGIDGERRVGKVLDSIANGNGNAYAFHSVKLPGHFGDVDHLLVVGTTLFVIDTKNWKSDASYSVGSDGETILRDGNTFAGGKVSVGRYVGEFREFIASYGVKKVRGLLVIANSKSVTQRNPSDDWDFVNLSTLRDVVYDEMKLQKKSSVGQGAVRRLASRVVNPDFGGDWDAIVHGERGRGETTQYRAPSVEAPTTATTARWLHLFFFPAWLVATLYVFVSTFTPMATLPKIAWWGVLAIGLLFGLWSKRQTSALQSQKGTGIVFISGALITATVVASLVTQTWL